MKRKRKVNSKSAFAFLSITFVGFDNRTRLLFTRVDFLPCQTMQLLQNISTEKYVFFLINRTTIKWFLSSKDPITNCNGNRWQNSSFFLSLILWYPLEPDFWNKCRILSFCTVFRYTKRLIDIRCCLGCWYTNLFSLQRFKIHLFAPKLFTISQVYVLHTKVACSH